jgi:hypothetical protein
MNNAYVEVLRSYPRRAYSSFSTGFSVTVSLLVIALTSLHYSDKHASLVFILFAITFAGDFPWRHLREQLAQTRRHLAPHFLKPHLAAFALVSGLFVIAAPAWMSFSSGHFSLGPTAAVMAIYAMIGWSTFFPQPASSVLSMAGWMCLIFQGDRPAIIAFLTGGYERLASWMFVAAAGATILAVVRLCRVREDVRKKPRWDGRRGGIRIPPGAGFWARAYAWSQVGGGLVVKSLLIVAVMMVVAACILSRYLPRDVPIIPFLAVWPEFICTVIIPMSWMGVWRNLAGDSLRPIDRRSFLREIGAALAIQYAQGWAIFSTTAIIVCCLCRHDFLSGHMVATLLISSLALQVFNFAACVWLLQWRSPGLLTGFVYVMGIVVLPFAMLVGQDNPLSALGAGAVVLGAIGVYIAAEAWHCWQTTELG